MLGNKSSKINVQSLGNKKNGQIVGLGNKLYKVGLSNQYINQAPIKSVVKKSYLEK